MAFVLADKVREAVNAPSTSDFELLGPPPSADTLTFASQIGDGNTTRYQAWGAEGWEIGIGTVSTGATNRLLRPGTVLVNSSGGTALIDFQGPVQVACVFSTTDLPYQDENGDIPARGGRDLGTDADRWRNLWLSGDVESGGEVAAWSRVISRSTGVFIGNGDFAALAPTSDPSTGGNVRIRPRGGGNATNQTVFNDDGTVDFASDIKVSGRVVVEGGDNSNGYYVRYSDGTQICWKQSFAIGTSTTTWTPPASFLSDEDAAISAHERVTTTGVGPRIIHCRPSAGSFVLRAFDLSGNEVSADVSIMAIGRWA